MRSYSHRAVLTGCCGGELATIHRLPALQAAEPRGFGMKGWRLPHVNWLIRLKEHRPRLGRSSCSSSVQVPCNHSVAHAASRVSGFDCPTKEQ